MSCWFTIYITSGVGARPLCIIRYIFTQVGRAWKCFVHWHVGSTAVFTIKVTTSQTTSKLNKLSFIHVHTVVVKKRESYSLRKLGPSGYKWGGPMRKGMVCLPDYCITWASPLPVTYAISMHLFPVWTFQRKGTQNGLYESNSLHIFLHLRC